MKLPVLLLLLITALTACASPGETDADGAAETSSAALRASDPATFVRAAGYPQFLELFTFW